MTRVSSLRAQEDEWETWREAAELQGLSLNAWAIRSLNHAADLEKALEMMTRERPDFEP